MLSDQPIRSLVAWGLSPCILQPPDFNATFLLFQGSLLPNKHKCRCYRRGAVWGYVEAPFSGPGAGLRISLQVKDCEVPPTNARKLLLTFLGRESLGVVEFWNHLEAPEAAVIH